MAQPRIIRLQIPELHRLRHSSEERNDDHLVEGISKQVRIGLAHGKFGNENKIVVDRIDVLLIPVIGNETPVLQALPHEFGDIGIAGLLLLHSVRPAGTSMVRNNDVGYFLIPKNDMKGFVCAPSLRMPILHRAIPFPILGLLNQICHVFLGT